MQNQPIAHDTRKSAQVLPFRRPGKPLTIVTGPVPRQEAKSAEDDFARYEREHDGPSNERHRMLMNLIAVAVVVLLITSGIWIADAIQISVKNQDCALQGRTNCAPIEMPPRR